MKINLNLAVAPSRRDRYALTWAAPLLVIGVVILGWLAGTALRDIQNSRAARRSLAGLQAKDADLRSREVALGARLGQPKFQHMISETQFVNRLMNQRQFSLTELTVKVAKLLPPAVRLNNLGLAGTTSKPEIRFSVVGKTEEATESFLRNLEDSKDFSNVTIKNQGFRGGGGSGAEMVALTCTALYVTALPSLPPGQ